MALRSNGGGRQEAAQARHSSDCLRRICLLHLKRWLSVHPVHCVALSVPYGRARTVRSTLADHPQAGTRSGEKRKMKPHPDPLPVSCQAESLKRPEDDMLPRERAGSPVARSAAAYLGQSQGATSTASISTATAWLTNSTATTSLWRPGAMRTKCPWTPTNGPRRT